MVRRRVFALALVAVAADTASAQPGPTTPLTLEAVLATARAAAPVVSAAQARVAGMREAATRAGRWLNPVVELRSENWPNAAPGGLPLDVFATVTQTVELGGKRAARRHLAGAGVAAVAAAAELAWRDVARVVTADYLSALAARDEVRIRTAHAERLAEASRVMARRVEVGSAAEGDLLKLRTEEALALLARTRAEVGAARAVARLEAALGTTIDSAQLVAPTRPPLSPSTTLAATHPDLVAASAAVDQARAALALEATRRVPDAALNTGMKRTAGYNTGVVAITVAVPLFDANGQARALATGQLRAAEHEREAVVARLTGEMNATRAAANTLGAGAAVAQATLVVPAAGARDAARAAFAAGALDVLRLVDAERVYVDAALAAQALELDAISTTIDARLAAGEDPLP